MKTVQVYLHGEGNPEPKIVEVAADATITELINQYSQYAPPGVTLEEIDLYFENEHQARDKHHHLEHAGIKNRHHVHCHRCKRISVNVEYNGQVKTIPVPPSAVGKEILVRAAREFNITQKDAADLILKMSDGTVLQKTDHIGSFVAYPHCEIKLSLIHDTQVQG